MVANYHMQLPHPSPPKPILKYHNLYPHETSKNINRYISLTHTYGAEATEQHGNYPRL